MPKIETRPWDPIEFLKTDEDLAEYLEAALEDGDPALVSAVLDNIARAKGVALPPEGRREFATVLKVLEDAGLRLHATVKP